MSKSKKTPSDVIPMAKAPYFRDELNFAEFPLASLGGRSSTESLVFEDQVYDRGASKLVTRRLTVSPSSEYGLPTAIDEEVLLGLIQLTSKSGFKDKTVEFTRYELIDELGWTHQSYNYARIEDSLKKWLGVTLYYDNAWWCNEEKSWVSEAFHVLDGVTMVDKKGAENHK